MSGIRPGSGFWGCPSKDTMKWYGKKALEVTGISAVAVAASEFGGQQLLGVFGDHACQEVNSTLVNTTLNNATYIFSGESMYLTAGYAAGIGVGAAVVSTLFLYAAATAIRYQCSEKSKYNTIPDDRMEGDGLNTPRDDERSCFKCC